MKKRSLSSMIALALCLTLALGVAATAASTATRTLTATYADIKLVVNGTAVTPTDANGNVVEPFACDGTTYLPVRAVANALGQDVEWDGETNTIYIGEKSNEEEKTDTAATDWAKMRAGDEVTLVGKKANATLVNGNTIWLQAQQPDGTFITFHCQMNEKDLEAAGGLSALTVVKVKGCFLSYVDLGVEYTSPIVTLYDCELI